MRVTINIPDAFYRELKKKAMKERCSLKEIVLRGLERGFHRNDKSLRRVKLPLIPSKEHGTLKIDNSAIYELIEFP